ncbi:MAG: translocation/assembly module TamB domain-containing protein, partial [Pseudomonadota bacterium]
SERIEGSATLDASGSRFGPLDADASFTVDDETAALSSLRALALGVTIEGALDYDLRNALANGAVTVEAPDLAPLSAFGGTEARGSLSGRLDLTPVAGQQDVSLDLRAEDVSVLDVTFARFDVEGTVEDALGAPSLDLVLDAAGAQAAGVRLASLSGKVAGADLLGAGEARYDLRLGGFSGFGATLDAASLAGTLTNPQNLAAVKARLDASGLSAAGVRVGSLGADITAADALSETPTATLDLRATRIAGPANMESARLNARLGQNAGQATLDADLTTGTIDAGGARIAGLDLDMAAADALSDDPRLDVRLNTGPIKAEGATLDGFTARVEGLLSALRVALSTQGAAGMRPVSLDAAAEVNAKANTPRARITRLDAGYGEEEIALNAPVTVTAGEAIAIDGLDLALPGGRLDGDATLYPTGLAADLNLALDDLGVVRRLADVPVLSGRLALNAALDSRAGRATGRFNARLDDLRVEEIGEDLTPFDIAAEGRWDGRIARLDSQIGGPFGQPLLLELGLPLRAANPVPVLVEGGALSGAVRWQGDIGEVWALVPAADHVLDGAVDLDLSLSGTLAEPGFGGSVSLREGRYENLEFGTILTDLTLGSEISGGDDITLNLSAHDGAQGSIAAEVTLAGDTLDAKATSQSAVLVRRDDASAAISLDIAAQGPLSGPDLSGTITIDRAEIRLVNATPPSVVTLGEVRIKGEPVPEPSPPAGTDIGLDIAVRAPRDVFVRGRGLDSEWAIDLDIAGNAARPLVTGAIERLRGRLDLLGTRFDLATGRIAFDGGRTIDPNLDVRLQTEKNAITGGIAVSGTASAPEIGFFSVPGLPEDEVLPRLLYGRSSQSLSAGQAVQLASGIATLLDGSDSTLGSARQATGLDVIDLDTSGETAAVTVGKNLGENVFVGAKQSVDGGETEVVVEIEVFENIILDGEIDQEGAASVGINWKRDF